MESIRFVLEVVYVAQLVSGGLLTQAVADKDSAMRLPKES